MKQILKIFQKLTCLSRIASLDTKFASRISLGTSDWASNCISKPRICVQMLIATLHRSSRVKISKKFLYREIERKQIKNLLVKLNPSTASEIANKRRLIHFSRSSSFQLRRGFVAHAKNTQGERNGKSENALLKPAFTLIEVMIATIVIGISVTALFGLQSNLMRSIFSSHEILQRLVIAKNIFIAADQEDYYKRNETIIKKIEKPESTLTYAAVTTSGEIANKFPQIKLEKVNVSWPATFGKNKITFTGLRFISNTGDKRE